MQSVLWFILILFPVAVFGQLHYNDLSSEGEGEGGTFSTLEGPSSIFSNPAGMASVESFSLVMISQNIAGFDGLQTSGFGLIFPSSMGSFSFSGIYHGDNLLNSRKISLGWAQKLGIAQLGMQGGWLNSSLQGVGGFNSILIDFSGIVEFSPHVKAGAAIFNMFNAKYSPEDKAPVIARTALDYSPVPAFHLIAEAEKNLQYEPNYKIGISYLLRKRIYFATGIKLNPINQAFGFGLLLKKIVVHWSLINLPGLGTRQSLSLAFITHGKENE